MHTIAVSIVFAALLGGAVLRKVFLPTLLLLVLLFLTGLPFVLSASCGTRIQALLSPVAEMTRTETTKEVDKKCQVEVVTKESKSKTPVICEFAFACLLYFTFYVVLLILLVRVIRLHCLRRRLEFLTENALMMKKFIIDIYGDRDAEKIREHVDKIVGNLMLDLQERGAL